MNFTCWGGLTPFLYSAIRHRSAIALVVYANGTLYHLLSRRWLLWDVFWNVLFTAYAVGQCPASRLPAVLAVGVYALNLRIASDWIHVAGVQFPLWVGLTSLIRHQQLQKQG